MRHPTDAEWDQVPLWTLVRLRFCFKLIYYTRPLPWWTRDWTYTWAANLLRPLPVSIREYFVGEE